MKNLSISGAALVFVVLSLLAGVALVTVAVLVLDDARNVQAVWQQFDSTRSEKSRALNALKRELGYGGLIHHFKNYILRTEVDRIRIVEQKIGGAKAAIERYRALGTGNDEDQALKDIDTALRNYRDALKVAQQLVNENKPAIVVDRVSAVYGRPTLEALEVLSASVRKPGSKLAGRNKAALLNELHQAMGYGGLIHEFKLYVLRNVGEHAERMRAKLATSNEVLAKYQATQLTPAEQRALAAVQRVVNGYDIALNNAVLLAKDNILPREIDRRVSVDDGPALVGFATLTRALVAQNQTAAASLASSIERIQEFARQQLWAVVAIVILLVAGEIWLFFNRIIWPLGHLNRAMLQLADGNLDITIPEAGSKTEIGRMAGAMEVFRTNAIARERAENQLRDQNRSAELLHRISVTANEAVGVEEAIKICLDEISADTGWPVGHAYLHTPKDGVDLVPTKIWHLGDPDGFAAFRQVTERTGFKRGEGLPGRVLDSGQPAWIADVTKDANFPRAKLAADIGVKAGFAFPVSVGDRVIAVLEFFATDAVEPDQRTLEVMANVGEQLGSLILRKQTEQQLRESEERLSAILEASPVGVSIVDNDGKRKYVNARLAELLGQSKDEAVEADISSSFADSADRDRLRAMFERDGHVRDLEAEYVDTNGNRFWVLLTMEPTEYQGEAARMVWIYDITERKQAEAALAEKEAQLRLVFENMDEGVVLYDRDMILTAFNEQARRHMRFPKDVMFTGASFEDIGTYAVSQSDPENGDAAAQTKERRKSLKKGIPHSFEYVHRDGTVIETRRRIVPDGGFVVTHTDITERRRAEEELARKEAQLRVALDNMPGGMVLADRDGKFMFFNSQYRELHDYPDGLLKIGGTVVDTVRFQAQRGDYGPGDTDALIEEVCAPYDQTETVDYERTIANGRTLHFNVAPTPEGGYVTIATDITERKRAEEELTRKEAQLRVALDNMPGGMALGDKDRKFVFINSQYSELHDYPDGLLKVGGPMLDEARFQAQRGDYGPGDTEELIEGVFNQYSQKKTVSYERTIANGRPLHFNVAPTPEGGYVTIATDITERKQAEEELARKEAQ